MRLKSCVRKPTSKGLGLAVLGGCAAVAGGCAEVYGGCAAVGGFAASSRSHGCWSRNGKLVRRNARLSGGQLAKYEGKGGVGLGYQQRRVCPGISLESLCAPRVS
jgi:hypothetical protein